MALHRIRNDQWLNIELGTINGLTYYTCKTDQSSINTLKYANALRAFITELTKSIDEMNVKIKALFEIAKEAQEEEAPDHSLALKEAEDRVEQAKGALSNAEEMLKDKEQDMIDKEIEIDTVNRELRTTKDERDAAEKEAEKVRNEKETVSAEFDRIKNELETAKIKRSEAEKENLNEIVKLYLVTKALDGVE